MQKASKNSKFYIMNNHGQVLLGAAYLIWKISQDFPLEKTQGRPHSPTLIVSRILQNFVNILDYIKFFKKEICFVKILENNNK